MKNVITKDVVKVDFKNNYLLSINSATIMIKTIVFAFIFAFSLIFLYLSLKKLYLQLTIAKPDVRWDNIGLRIIHTIKVAFLQSKIFRDSAAGPLHAGIFWGFLILLFTASESVFQGFYHSFSWSFLGPLYTIITFFTDVFIVIVFAMVIFAFFRRFVVKIPRLRGDAEEKKDALAVLGAIFVIISSLMLEKASAIIIYPASDWAFQPVAAAISTLISYDGAKILYEICWWVHILVILAFMNYLPYSKHLHVYTSILNVFFSPVAPVNTIERINFEEEGVEKFGVVDINDFSWKSLFDGYTCTHCGRCTAVCPANLTGKELNPQEVIVQIRKRTKDAAAIMLKQKNLAKGEAAELSDREKAILEKPFIGEYESVEALWQCTTCGACMQECPVNNEHVPAIVGMRRSLVMMESNFPTLLQSSFANMENNASPWAFSPMERADWAEGLGIKTAAEHPDFDILFWVGCAGSYDDRAKKISVAFAKLLQKAGINFAILGTEEQCNGDLARRTGNEYLADMLIKMNIETFNNYNVKKIVTICPHCFNTFKNDYPAFGAKLEVVHHSTFLNELIEAGKLKLKKTSPKTITYHDSCYLGRYNDIYDAPRSLLLKVPGLNIIEPERTRDRGFCCGAGGGQMFMEETAGKRVNIERTEELLATGVKTIAANCPFCMTMISDGIKAKDKDEEVFALDIAEIILENIAD